MNVNTHAWFHEIQSGDAKEEITTRMEEIGEFHKKMDMIFRLGPTMEYSKPQLEFDLKKHFTRWILNWPPNSDNTLALSLNPDFRSAQLFVLIPLLNHNLLKIK